MSCLQGLGTETLVVPSPLPKKKKKEGEKGISFYFSLWVELAQGSRVLAAVPRHFSTLQTALK